MRFVLLIIIGICTTRCALSQSAETNLEIHHLTGDFYVYKTFSLYKGVRISANGLYLVTDAGVVVVDSPWDTTQFQPLLDSIKYRHNKQVVMCIATHFHEDRTAGLEYYRQRGIKTFTTKKTDDLSKVRGMSRAEFLIANDTTFNLGQCTFETYYPGPGHAPDNIVIWFTKEKVLYGGCLIKSLDDSTLGNLGDASVGKYATTIQNVKRKFANAKFVIPGHNGWSSTQAIDHTLRMAKALK